MLKFKVKIQQSGTRRTISVIAKCSIDALLSVMGTINPNEPSRVTVGPA